MSAANVGGLGPVLVNGNGATLYVLSSEQGGTSTCTSDNGCTNVWRETKLPPGTTKGIAGAGVDASLLATTTNGTGDLSLTYGGFPLYTFTGDSGPGQANGVGIMSFGGTWSAISPGGTLVGTPPMAAATSGSDAVPTTAGPAPAGAGAPTTTTRAPATTKPPTTTAPPPTTQPRTTTTPPPTTTSVNPPSY